MINNIAYTTDLKDVYPLTIVYDRYGGTYSDAKYLAFNLDPAEIPTDVGGDDGEEMEFWADNGPHTRYKIGKGATAELAIIDLIDQIHGKGAFVQWEDWEL